MSTRLYVGNLAYSTTQADLEELFAEYGQVSDVHLLLDRVTGRSRGFAFVTMSSVGEAEAAATALNGKDFQGRKLTVNEARPREERPNGGGRGPRGDRGDRGDRYRQ
jgi:cold-inducible RNA-binding protein